jgi:DNA phosphorothioation-associated putative methyltransferase
VSLAYYRQCLEQLKFGKRLPAAIYIARLEDWTKIPPELAATIQRAMIAAAPDSNWNLLKLHTDQVAITFLSYPNFDEIPHPPLAESTKINLNTGTVVRTDYRKRANPPILHRKETFLCPGDSRRQCFGHLTKQEEAAGLYRDPHRIGLRLQWQMLLKRHGLGYDGHTLIRLNSGVSVAPEIPDMPAVQRHRTAIKRYDLSKPVKLALDRGILTKERSFFDYGCGHGMDVEALENLGFETAGWDPAFRPEAKRRTADIVNLGYVLNVIEDAVERIDALRQAFALARHALVVSTLVAGQETGSHSCAYKDGFLTKANTFQKFYAPGELESLIESTLDSEVITLSLGVCVVFKEPDDAEIFEASRSRRRIDWANVDTQLRFTSSPTRERRRVDHYELHRELFDAYWQCLLDLGRMPEVGEFDRLADLRRAAGGLTRAHKLVLEKNGEALFLRARAERTEDVLVYLAMTNFRKKFLRREIPQRIQRDIRSFFGDLALAKEKARDILFSAGDPGELEQAIKSLSFGHFDREKMQFTFHRSLLDKLPSVLRVYVRCGAVRYGSPGEADLIKIHVRSGKLSFLHYENFDRRKNPILLTRIKINLRNQFVQVFDHSAEKQQLDSKRRYL